VATLIAPSVLSCDPVDMARQVRVVTEAGADWLHVDIMDGHFVPALSFGPRLVEAIRRVSDLPLDVHLMVDEPERWVEPFAAAGAAYISFHVEATYHPRRLCRHIRSLGARAGLALNPATSPDVLRYLARELDLVLVMSVDPGFAAQPFIAETIPKVREVARILAEATEGTHDRSGADGIRVEVDGGVGPDNVADLVRAGADVLVAGNSIFGRPDPAVALGNIRKALG